VFWWSQGFLHLNHVIWKQIILLLPFWFECFLILFLPISSKISTTMLNRGGESRHPCLDHDLRRKVCFSPLSIMLGVGFSHMAFIMLRYFLFILSLLSVFIIIGCWILSMPFLHLLRWFCYLIVCYAKVVYHVDWFSYAKTFLHLQDKSHMVMVCYSFNVLLNSVS